MLARDEDPRDETKLELWAAQTHHAAEPAESPLGSFERLMRGILSVIEDLES